MNLSLRKMKLTAKFIPPILAGSILALLSGAMVLVNGVETSSRQQIKTAQTALLVEQSSAKEAAMKALESKANIIGRFMAKTAPNLIASFDFSSLKEYQKEATEDHDIVYAAYLKPEGDALTDYTAPKNKNDIMEKSYPIVYEGETMGSVLLGISTAGVKQGIDNSNERIAQAITEVKQNGNATLNHFVQVTAIEVLAVLVVISAIVVFMFRAAVIKPTLETNALVSQLSKGHGDLTVRLPIKYHDELGELRESVNSFIAQLQKMISSIVNEVQTLNDEAVTVRQFGTDMSATSEAQQGETEQAATAMNQMVATVHEVARNTTAAAAATEQADVAAKNGFTVVNNTVESISTLAHEVESTAQIIQTLAKDSDAIGTVLDVIRGIAEQTNLLALNAAIEAARAGEQGRGFAVVADEVRTLASRTQQSTQEIQQMIQRLQSGTQNAVDAMEKGRSKAQHSVEQATQAGTSLEEISRTVATIYEMNTQIATASEQQAAVADEISRNITNVQTLSNDTAENAKRTAQSSEHLSNIAFRLQDLADQFKT